MTRAELSARSGVSLRALAYYESGQRIPSIPTAARIADALGVRVESLVADIVRSYDYSVAE